MRLHLPGLGLLTLLSCCCAGNAQEQHDPVHHYTLQVPDGWEPLSPQVLDAANQLAQANRVRYESGLQPRNLVPGNYPYILIQVTKAAMTGVSLDALERDFAKQVGKVKQLDGPVQNLVSEAGIGSAVMDRAKQRVIMRVELNAAGVGKVQGVSYGMIGRDGIILVHCYAKAADFAQYLPVFNALAESFRYDPGFGYGPAPAAGGAPGAPPSFGSGLTRGLVAGAVGGAVAGVLAALLILVVRKLRPPAETKRKKKRRRSDEDDDDDERVSRRARHRDRDEDDDDDDEPRSRRRRVRDEVDDDEPRLRKRRRAPRDD